MRAQRYSVEQIVAKLREAEKLQAQEMTIAPSYTSVASPGDGHHEFGSPIVRHRRTKTVDVYGR